MDPQQAAVMAEYDEFASGAVCRPVERQGGFSDAALWEVTTPGGRFALRRWPEGQPTPPRRAWMHRFLRFVRDRGLSFIAAPCKTRSGATFVELAGRSWEVALWLPGAPERVLPPSAARIAAAADALAQFHRASALFPPGPSRGPSPGLADRASLTRMLRTGGVSQMRQAVERFPEGPQVPHSLRQKSLAILDFFEKAATRVELQLNQCLDTTAPLLPCLRDVWSEHVLFDGNTVTGIIDYGAMRTDCVAGDLSRLLGSYVADDPQGWQLGIDAYAARRSFAPGERELIRVFDASSVLLSGTSWVRWIFVDGVQFVDLSAVEQRMDHWLARLPHLVS